MATSSLSLQFSVARAVLEEAPAPAAEEEEEEEEKDGWE
jgi:hypothetical protein